MHASVTINKARNSEAGKEGLGKALHSGFSICRDTCDLDL